jgi:GAF domain-containing protein
MTESPLELAQSFAEIAQELAAQGSVAATLEGTVRFAVDVVPGCEYAGISWLQAGKEIETPAWTDEIVRMCDEAQYKLNEGPCVEAAWEGDTCHVDDMRTETRWPNFAARAAELGIRSMLACQLASPKKTVGALNLYASTPNAFEDAAGEIALIFAAHASIALANRRLEADLRNAVDTRGIIGQAMGVLIERHRVTPQRAFDLLVRASQHRHIKLRDLAAQVVETGIDPITDA